MRGLRLLAAFAMLAVSAAFRPPCFAQSAPLKIPILNQHVTSRRMLFAQGDGGVAFYGGTNTRDLSNVWIEVNGSQLSPKRGIKALTEVWVDAASRQHSLSVLKLQIDYNAAITAKAYDPYFHKWSDHEPFVLESGILDRETLAIPYTRLITRARAISARLRYTAASNGASYVFDSLNAAYAKLRELDAELRVVPVLQTVNMPSLRSDVELDGFRDLAWPEGFSSRGRDKYYDVYASGAGETPPERLVTEFIDLSALTPVVVERLQQKERAAAKAVEFAASLCEDLLGGGCE